MTAVYKFSRPHTIIGTAISVISISMLALEGASPTLAAGVALLQALASALLMNVAIVGINQLYDVEIDKVNKPYLPLASGEMTQQQGTAIVAATALGGLAIGVASGSLPLLLTLGVSLLLGVLYSTDHPLMRWKRSPLLAAGCILVVSAQRTCTAPCAHACQGPGQGELAPYSRHEPCHEHTVVDPCCVLRYAAHSHPAERWRGWATLGVYTYTCVGRAHQVGPAQKPKGGSLPVLPA